jgi:Flp pilus assembly protein TadB
MSEFMDKWEWILWIILGVEIFLTFCRIFWWVRETSMIHNAFLRVQKTWKIHKTLIEKVDKMLLYSGLHQKWKFLTTERWILLQIMVVSGIILGAMLLKIVLWKCGLVLVFYFIAQYVWISMLIASTYKKVDEELLKFLDFLGNYSITSGEITSILFQISGYLEEPLKSVLRECYYEAQTFGDTSAALISMSKKVQHPKFAELIRNVEVTMRYSADFTILVSQSRRAIRENMRLKQERKALAKEAAVNMLILGGMTVVIFLSVEKLTGISMEDVLLKTGVGRGCLLAIIVIVLLFYRQVRNIDR